MSTRPRRRVEAADEFLKSEFRSRLDALFPTDKRLATEELRKLKASLLGYGEVEPARCLFCADQRVTLLG
jgi:hypothetical protein